MALSAIPVETMRTLLVCRGPIAFETLEVYRRCRWQLPHVVISAREWLAERQRTAPWIVDVPCDRVHYIQEYDDAEAVLQIAKMHQMDAIYPGYGFFAESAMFAAQVEQTGLRFIGPTPEMLRAVGDKDAAIALAKRLGIPTIPGDDALIAFARRHGQDAIIAETVRRTQALARQYPGATIRLKHPAGGGGKGQYVLSSQALQDPELSAVIRSALAKVWAEMGVSAPDADARKGVLLELHIPRPLHWEVQLLGDGRTVVHLAARDCSLQNSASQKFIEMALYPEALARELPQMDPQRDTARRASLQQRLSTLEQVCVAALRLGTAIRLRGVATVEFLIDMHGRPYFLEVNPRIQVEHAVTECITRVRGHAVSLVEFQQRVAAGEMLDFRQEDITWVGDALEVRLNAWHEDLSPVLGGVVHALRLDTFPPRCPGVRLDAGGLLQRSDPWLIPSYDANFALLVVAGEHRRATLARMINTLETAVHLHGNTALHTNLQTVLGLLTLMQAVPSSTEFRTDTSALWMACVALVLAQKQAVLARLSAFPHRSEACYAARFARLLHSTVAMGFVSPSRLLTYYLRRLTEATPRPLCALEVLWQLAEELGVPQFAEERQQWEALRAAITTLWTVLSASPQRYTTLIRATTEGRLTSHPDYNALCTHLHMTDADLGDAEADQLLHACLTWLSMDIPAITELIRLLESTQLHTCLTVTDDLALRRPDFCTDERQMARLHDLLSRSVRPVVLRHGELCAPMDATLYHHSQPGAPPFVQRGAEVHVGQTLALLEAMKMFTELTSPVDGVVVDILAVNGQGVTTGAPLFKIATHEAHVDTADDILQRIVDTPGQHHFGLVLGHRDIGDIVNLTSTATSM